MKKAILIAALAVLLIGCNKRSHSGNFVQKTKSVDTEHNVVIRFNGLDKNIPEDGELMVVKCTLVDTIIVEPATDDDCRRILESHGKG